MRTFYKKNDGSIGLNFSLIDTVLDFLQSIHLFPHLVLDYIPEELFPLTTESLGIWSSLLQQFLSHCENRYGKDNMELWIITIWLIHESPEYPARLELDTLVLFYTTTYQTIRKINPNIYLATPWFLGEKSIQPDIMEPFLDELFEKECWPDIFDFNFYPIEFTLKDHKEQLSEHPEILCRELDNLISRMKKYPPIKYHLCGWNFAINQNALNDTMFRAVYVLKNILSSRKLSSPVYIAGHTLSDLMSGLPSGGQFFSGGTGIFMHQNIKKPIYYTYLLLQKLGSYILSSGDGYFISKTGNDLQILLYHYVHYNNEYAKNPNFDLTYKNRTLPFDPEPDLEIAIPIRGGDFDEFTMTETILSEEYGSAYDTWKKTGFIPLEKEDSVDYIRSVSVPFTYNKTIKIENGEYLFLRQLKPLEIRLIELRPQ